MEGIPRSIARVILLGSLSIATAFAGEASAQSWTGLGGDDNWSTGGNWSSGVAPASSATTFVTFPSVSSGVSPTNVDLPWTVNRIDVGAGAGFYLFTGEAITFAGAAPAINGAAALMQIENPIVFGAGLVVSTPGNGPLVRFDGPVSGSGPITVSGDVNFRANTVSGGLNVAGSSLATFVSFSGSVIGPVNVSGGGLQMFNASVTGPVTVGGATTSLFIASGTISGPLTVVSGGIVSVQPEGVFATGDLTVSGELSIQIQGTSRGTEYSGIDVTGAVNVAGARLLISNLSTLVPALGDVFTIIANDGTDPVIGAFDGLPEGATIPLNGIDLRISYVGGTGNDVTLTAVGPNGGPGPFPQAPTLSQWALVLLAGLVLALGMRVSVRRR